MPRNLPDYLPPDWPDYAELPSLIEWKRAVEEDRNVSEVLGKDQEQRFQPMATPDSIRAGNSAIAQGRIRAAETTMHLIECKELLNADEFCEMCGVTRDWLSDALTEGRLFAIVGPCGRSFFPSFYADSSIKREEIESVARVLSPLHPASQYWFFTSVWTSLKHTPLGALRTGQLRAVMAAAEGVVDGAPRPVLSVVDEAIGQSGPLTAPTCHNPCDSFADNLSGISSVKSFLGRVL